MIDNRPLSCLRCLVLESSSHARATHHGLAASSSNALGDCVDHATDVAVPEEKRERRRQKGEEKKKRKKTEKARAHERIAIQCSLCFTRSLFSLSFSFAFLSFAFSALSCSSSVRLHGVVDDADTGGHGAGCRSCGLFWCLFQWRTQFNGGVGLCERSGSLGLNGFGRSAAAEHGLSSK